MDRQNNIRQTDRFIDGYIYRYTDRVDRYTDRVDRYTDRQIYIYQYIDRQVDRYKIGLCRKKILISLLSTPNIQKLKKIDNKNQTTF